MGKLTLEDVLNSGIPLEDILFNKEPVNVNVDIPADAINKTLKAVSKENKETLKQIQNIITTTSNHNKSLITQSMKLLLSESVKNSKVKPTKEIKGLKVIRNELQLIDRLIFTY